MTIGPMMACASFGLHRGEKLFSIKEVAQIVFDGKSERFVRDLISMGRLEAVNISVKTTGRRELMVRESAIDAFLARSKFESSKTIPKPAILPSRSRKKKDASAGFSDVIRDHLEKRGKR